MGGVRTAGDLVARMEFSKNMKLAKAKEYVAKKLGISEIEIADETVMRDLRYDLGLGNVTSIPGAAKGMEAKLNIEKVLGITINSCEKFRGTLR